jgi:ribosome-associated protein
MAQKIKYTTDPDTLPAECEIEFYSGTGKGGQNRNRHYNCVRIHHLPSGVIVVGTEERSQLKNRESAFQRLIEKLEALNYVKPKRKPTRMTASTKRKHREGKIRQAKKKSSRKKIISDNSGDN